MMMAIPRHHTGEARVSGDDGGDGDDGGGGEDDDAPHW